MICCFYTDQSKRDSTTKRKINSLGSFFSSNGTNRARIRFSKCLYGYSRLFTEREKEMKNYLLPEEIEEFLGNPTRFILSFFSDKW